VGTILDPSFGGCAFLNSALDVLSARSTRRPWGLIHGVDSDPAARSYLHRLTSAGARDSQFVTADFLGLTPQDMPRSPFDAIVGNPPYVRHHLLDGPARLRAESAMRASGVVLSGRSSYWAYFLAHAMRFLTAGGRIAFVLPGAFLHADYARDVRASILRSFEDVAWIAVGERLFEDAEETTVVLLASGFGGASIRPQMGWAPSLQQLEEMCLDVKEHTRPVLCSDDRTVWLLSVIGERASAIYGQLAREGLAARLGQHARVKVGTVTGGNDFFILARPQCRAFGISDRWLRPIIASSRDLQGMEHNDLDQQHLDESNTRCLLIDTGGKRNLPRGLSQYLETGKAAGIDVRFKCAQRGVWHQVPDSGIPDAFMQYMCGDHPRIVLNRAEAACTNSLHQIIWSSASSRSGSRWIALGMLTSLSRLSAELCGRSYGGGLLKLEPGDATHLVLPAFPGGERCDAFEETEQLLRAGRREEARSLADSVLLRHRLGLTQKEIAHLRSACDLLRNLRRGRAAYSAVPSPSRRTNHVPGS